MGRPIWQTPDLEKVRRLAQRGLTMEQALAALPMPFWESVHNSNVTAQIFYLKARDGWVETDRREYAGKDRKTSTLLVSRLRFVS